MLLSLHFIWQLMTKSKSKWPHTTSQWEMRPYPCFVWLLAVRASGYLGRSCRARRTITKLIIPRGDHGVVLCKLRNESLSSCAGRYALMVHSLCKTRKLFRVEQSSSLYFTYYFSLNNSRPDELRTAISKK